MLRNETLLSSQLCGLRPTALSSVLYRLNQDSSTVTTSSANSFKTSCYRSILPQSNIQRLLRLHKALPHHWGCTNTACVQPGVLWMVVWYVQRTLYGSMPLPIWTPSQNFQNFKRMACSPDRPKTRVLPTWGPEKLTVFVLRWNPAW
jgi:hypothetical protein